VRRTLVLALLLAACLTAGCGAGRERGKNQDYDRPTTKQK
jgi:hypothetical protein